MNLKDLEQFDPNVAQLTQMVEQTKNITATDLEDPAQLEVVRKNRIGLKTARVEIQKTGKKLREDALSFQKEVIAKEKSLIAIIEPEEDRLQAIEEEAKRLATRKIRARNLPEFKARIAAAGLEYFHGKTDEELLDLDVTQLESYYNEMVAAKNMVSQMKAEEEAARIRAEQEAKEAEIREQQRKLDAERQAIEHEKAVKLAADEAAKATEERMKLEAERKAAAEAAAAKAEEERVIAEQKALEKKKTYLAFLKANGYTEETKADFRVERLGNLNIALFKKVAEYSDAA